MHRFHTNSIITQKTKPKPEAETYVLTDQSDPNPNYPQKNSNLTFNVQ